MITVATHCRPVSLCMMKQAAGDKQNNNGPGRMELFLLIVKTKQKKYCNFKSVEKSLKYLSLCPVEVGCAD